MKSVIDSELLDKASGLDEHGNQKLPEEVLSLSLAVHGIMRIENLETFTCLKRLNLSHNNIQRIANLDSLVHLEYLDLSANSITKVEGLDELSKLKFLHLMLNRIKNIEGVNNLKNLRYLNLAYNRINSYEFLNIAVFTRFAQSCSLSVHDALDNHQKRKCNKCENGIHTCKEQNYWFTIVSTLESIWKLDGYRVQRAYEDRLKTLKRHLRCLYNIYLTGNDISKEQNYWFTIVSTLESIWKLDGYRVQRAYEDRLKTLKRCASSENISIITDEDSHSNESDQASSGSEVYDDNLSKSEIVYRFSADVATDFEEPKSKSVLQENDKFAIFTDNLMDYMSKLSLDFDQKLIKAYNKECFRLMQIVFASYLNFNQKNYIATGCLTDLLDVKSTLNAILAESISYLKNFEMISKVTNLDDGVKKMIKEFNYAAELNTKKRGVDLIAAKVSKKVKLLLDDENERRSKRIRSTIEKLIIQRNVCLKDINRINCHP
ncbi:hypothetical protein GJ496_002131 [Pomphorhynchus laevis]|nr:hypothetical protein GJ496_002131 [Pomphorhynchus laevis]